MKALLQRNPASIHNDGCGGGSGYTPLLYAAREGHVEVVAELLRLGATPNAATQPGGATALHRAAYQGHMDVVRLLLQAKANPKLQDSDGQTAVHKALQQGHDGVASILLHACPGLESVRDLRGRLAVDLLTG